MIKQKFKLGKYSWKVYVYYNATERNLNEIAYTIKHCHFPSDCIKSAYTILKRGSFNYGITLSNVISKTTIIVITKTTDASQFVNSFFHEVYHLVNHIAKTYNIDYDSEELCYLAGHIAQVMHKECYHLMCEHCKN